MSLSAARMMMSKVAQMATKPTLLARVPAPLAARPALVPLARVPHPTHPWGATGRRTLAAAASTTDEAPAAETFKYQAEVDRLMDMIVNSLYSNRDVFLRELISNASDALDKQRFLALTDENAMKSSSKMEIRVRVDKDANTLIIEDSGVGMTKEDMLSALGTIARSGTAKFAEAMKEANNDANLIGQFGVGFYSSFLVADKVRVQSKNPGEAQQWAWEAEAGAHSYTITPEADDLTRGTRVTLHLKEDAEEYLEEGKIESLIKQYSEFISFPIKLWGTVSESKQVVDEEATAKAREEAAKKREEGEEEVPEPEEVMKTETSTSYDWKLQNSNKPIWTRSPSEVTEEEYNAFFKQSFKEFMDPMAKTHFNVEGSLEFSGVLFVPGMAPFQQDTMMEKSRNIKLFVKRVFISDEFDEDLMPRYLNFIKGVLDSSDLPLNVSREILQENKITRVIRKQLVRRSLDMIKGIMKEDAPERDYATFWEAFGRNLKLGVIEDNDNRAKLADLLLFASSKSGEDQTTLADYVGRMKEGQKQIFFISAENREMAESSAFSEDLLSKGYELLYLTEPIDEVCLTNLGEYKEKQFADVSKEGVELDEDDKEALEAEEKALADTTAFLKATLGDKIEKAVVTSRLTDSPCVLVTSKFGWSANMERIMKNQTMGDSRAAEYMRGQRIMQINPRSAIIKKLRTMVEGGADDKAKQVTELLYETALLTSGFQVESPKSYAQKIYDMLAEMPTDAPEKPAAEEEPVKQVDAEIVE